MKHLLGMAAALIAFQSADAQVKPPAEPAPDKRQDKDFEGYKLKFEYAFAKVDGEDLITLFSDVDMEAINKGVTLRADRILVWSRNEKAPAAGDPAAPAPPVRAFYAEGNVVYKHYNERLKSWDSLRMQSVYFDVSAKKGYFYDIKTHHFFSKTNTDVVMHALEARLVAEGKIEAVEVKLSTCNYGDPHYFVKFKNVEMTGDHAIEKSKTDWIGQIWPYNPEDWKFHGEGMTVEIWGIPVFFLPALTVTGAALSTFPIHRISGGNSSRFGFNVETDWGITIRKSMVDAINPWDESGPLDDKEKWGELNWKIDWRRQRGWAFGLLPNWKWDGYQGYVNSYYMHDQGPNPNNSFDKKFLPLEDPIRGRMRLFHRQELTPNFRLELEASYLSDRNILEEFFEKEFKESKEQESVAYLRMLDENSGAFFQERLRLNDFQTQLEYLPRMKVFVFDTPVSRLLPGLTYSQEAEAVGLRQRFDQALGGQEPETWRLDTLNTISHVLDAGPIILSTFVDARFTWYQKDLVEDPATRFMATWGARATTELSKVYDLHLDLVGLDRMRHIMQFEARIASTFEDTLAPSQLFAYDATDTLDRFEEVTLKVRQRFQTKVTENGVVRTQEFLNFGLQAEYYPDEVRDTVGFNSNNFGSPFNWITLSPHDASKSLDERHWSNVHWDLAITPSKYFTATGNGEYNPVHSQEEGREYAINLTPSETITVSVGQTFVFDVTNAFTLATTWQMTEKWKVIANGQFDFKTGKFISSKVSVVRDFHDFIFEAIYEEDVGRDEKLFYLTFVPSFLRLVKTP